MTEGQIILLVFVIAFVLVGIILAFLLPPAIRKEKIRRQKVEEEYEKEPEYEFTTARVLSKRKVAYYKTELRMPAVPGLVNEYFITFATEKGESMEYPVREEFYENIVEGQEGTLVTVNGNFFDFGEGKEIDEVSEQE